MDRIVEKDQVLSIIPRDFRNSNKGKVKEIDDNGFSLELAHKPIGIDENVSMEFYSKTPNGMLYFNSEIETVDGNIVTVKNPIKHRYLKRRQFTRIRYTENLEFLGIDKSKHSVEALDLS